MSEKQIAAAMEAGKVEKNEVENNNNIADAETGLNNMTDATAGTSSNEVDVDILMMKPPSEQLEDKDAPLVTATPPAEQALGAAVVYHDYSASTSKTTKTSMMEQSNFWERRAMHMAHYPKRYALVALVISATLGVLGMTLDGIAAADHTGWHARGTVIGDRHAQLLLVRHNQEELAEEDSDEIWQDFIDNVQPGWENQNSVTGGDRHYRRRRKLRLLSEERNLQQEEQMNGTTTSLLSSTELLNCDLSWYGDGRMTNASRLWPVWKVRDLEQTSLLDPAALQDLCQAEADTQAYLQQEGLCFGCDDDKCLPPYGLVMFVRLTVSGGFDMDCQDLATSWSHDYHQQAKQEMKQCAIDLYNSNKTIEQLEEDGLPQSCPMGFDPNMVEPYYNKEGQFSDKWPQYTSSIYATREEDVDVLYEHVPYYDKAQDSTLIQGAYGTQHQDFVERLAETAVSTDMVLATASALITTCAILIHTKSPFLTMAGLLQICLSFPLSYFVYTYVLGIAFYPFLNFIGVFIVFALGADDVFVAVDKWKNRRNDCPNDTTEQIAAKALPDAAYAMLLTTSTTSVAFFGTAICPVAPIRVFAIFCGLLIALDYLMVIVILFPFLCIYDGYRYNNKLLTKMHSSTCFRYCISLESHAWTTTNATTTSTTYSGSNSQQPLKQEKDNNNGIEKEQDATFQSDSTTNNNDNSSAAQLEGGGGGDTSSESSAEQEEEAKQEQSSVIRRMLMAYYKVIYKLRWPLLVASMAAFVWSAVVASGIQLPETTEVRVLGPGPEFEDNYAWRLQLLSTALVKKGGSTGFWIWGVRPGDTGKHNNPRSFTQLLIDESFEPSTVEAQTYLRDFCDNFYKEEFFILPEPNYTCPFDRFQGWLEDQSSSSSSVNKYYGNYYYLNITTTTDLAPVNDGDSDTIWNDHCNGATGLPMDPMDFDACLIAWARQEEETSILSFQGKVQVIFFPFTSRVTIDSKNERLKEEWDIINDWMDETNRQAPEEVSKGFFSSADFWYYDTTTQMFNTAYGSVAIALAAAAVVILISSQSLIMTVFSVISVAYVLMSVIAMTIASGWALGFMESICFAIVIGISVDFVLHFSHAYTTLPGKVSKEKRTEFALIHMGPSILAAAFTTIAGATIMFFTTIQFFSMFATVLFYTIIQATVGSFVVFLTLTNCIGPSQPTYFVDKMAANFCGKAPSAEASSRGNDHELQEQAPGVAAAPSSSVTATPTLESQ